MEGTPLAQSKRYEDFVRSRDHALEDSLFKHLNAMDRVMDHLKDETEKSVSVFRLRMPSESSYYIKRLVADLDKKLTLAFEQTEQSLAFIISRLRLSAYALAYAGEAEAIGRATGKKTRVSITKDTLRRALSASMGGGGSPEQRVYRALSRLKTKILAEFQLSLLLDEKPEETLARVMATFPKKHVVKRPTRILKHPKLKEADRPGDDNIYEDAFDKEGISTGVVDPDTWDQITDDYIHDEIPFYLGREPKEVEDVYETTGRYKWEIENEATHDFVARVRDGQIDAAKENGISDFAWIAILDAKTDECCAVRDGLSSKEIEEKMESGAIDADECDASVPPAHFNCRCRVAPIADEMPEETPPDFGEFDDWLSARVSA